MEHKPPAKPIRIHRLYQADSLLRFYNFTRDDIHFDNNGNLSELIDPKTLYARNHPEIFPLEINSADFQMLIRVPGIGPIGAKRIIQLRRNEKIHYLYQLKKIGIRLNIAKMYILLSGKSYSQPIPNLFDNPENILSNSKQVYEKCWEN